MATATIPQGPARLHSRTSLQHRPESQTHLTVGGAKADPNAGLNTDAKAVPNADTKADPNSPDPVTEHPPATDPDHIHHLWACVLSADNSTPNYEYSVDPPSSSELFYYDTYLDKSSNNFQMVPGPENTFTVEAVPLGLDPETCFVLYGSEATTETQGPDEQVQQQQGVGGAKGQGSTGQDAASAARVLKGLHVSKEEASQFAEEHLALVKYLGNKVATHAMIEGNLTQHLFRAHRVSTMHANDASPQWLVMRRQCDAHVQDKQVSADSDNEKTSVGASANQEEQRFSRRRLPRTTPPLSSSVYGPGALSPIHTPDCLD